MASTRTSSFTQEEDVLLCSIYVEMTQDPNTYANQTREITWRRFENVYSGRKDQSWGHRSWRSLDSRYQKIDNAVKKLKQCLRMVELKTPSGISDRDIMDMAKQLMRTDSKWKSGFKFDHVWHMLKNLDKHLNGKTIVEDVKPVIASSESEDSTSKSPIQQSPGLSDFLIPSNENQSASGAKKMKQENEKLFELLAESNEIRKKQLKLEEDKVMLRDVNSIEDQLVREYFRRRQRQIVKSIIAEDARESQQPSAYNMNNL